MQRTESKHNDEKRHSFKTAAVIAIASMAAATLLMLAASYAIESGKLPSTYREMIVMICVLLGATPVAYLFSAREGKGALKIAAMSSILYIMILIVLSLCCDSSRIFSLQLIKNAISACAGIHFGSALYVFKRPKTNRARSRYYKQ